jgi:4-alpha-glucanotransferase
MDFSRSSGVLLHPTSLPGRYGLGDLGEWAYRFVDFLVETDQTLWQMLPLGPTSYGDSPYQALSTFAGNPLLINPDKLVGLGWLTTQDFADLPPFPREVVDYGWVIPWRFALLDKAYAGFSIRATPDQRAAFSIWADENAWWLDDFALFVALKEANDGHEWTKWEKPLALHQPAALEAALALHADAIENQKFRQWVFHTQWFELKAYANSKGVKLVGDIPIFVAHDSSDVWSARELFYLDADGMPTVVAGVPPDYFSPTGQRWGNPLYRWEVMQASGFEWWIKRVRSVLKLVDIVRIDHFRGFCQYWEIPASEETAIKGEWVDAPGQALFETFKTVFGDIPVIAEDLGEITPDVYALRDGFNLPGMKVLQFAWGDTRGINVFLPHNYVTNCIVYTGTHDNNTTVGWWMSSEATDAIKAHIGAYVGHWINDIHWEMIRLAMASVARMAVVPAQDLLGLSARARMNIPSVQGGNWAWRLTEEQFAGLPRQRLRDLTRFYARNPGAVAAAPDHSRK